MMKWPLLSRSLCSQFPERKQDVLGANTPAPVHCCPSQACFCPLQTRRISSPGMEHCLGSAASSVAGSSPRDSGACKGNSRVSVAFSAALQVREPLLASFGWQAENQASLVPVICLLFTRVDEKLNPCRPLLRSLALSFLSCGQPVGRKQL